jgi:phosphoribosylglycinamide formyltransferase-1
MTNGMGPLRTGSVSDPIRCAVLISGSGSGMEAMAIHQKTHLGCGHRTVLVISDNPEATGLTKAERLGIPAHCIVLPEETDHTLRRHLHEQQIQSLLQEHQVELILLSGYMRLVSADFVDQWTPRVINIHPSLLPAFPGAHAHRDVLAAGVEVSGCTVHYVDAGMDSGEIIGQRRVPVFTEDDEASLADRVKIEEHQLYPEIIDRIVS